jgi:hypothetical protein
VAVKIPKNLKAMKNKMTGNRSNKNLFIMGVVSLSEQLRARKNQ